MNRLPIGIQSFRKKDKTRLGLHKIKQMEYMMLVCFLVGLEFNKETKELYASWERCNFDLN